MAIDQDVRAQITVAATRVFQRWGYKRATMEDIAQEAGKGKATLYYYFRNKEEVFSSVLEGQIAEVRELLRRELAKESGPAEKLKRYFQLMYSEARRRVMLFNTLRMDAREDRNIVYTYRLLFDQDEIQLVRELIADGIERGIFKTCTAQEQSDIAYIISSSLRSLTIDLLISDSEDDDSRRIMAIGDLVVRGLMP